MRPDEIELWRAAGESDGETDEVCVMISCCAGAELQVRRDGAIVLRELYPDKATLYERAAELRASRGDRIASARPPAGSTASGRPRGTRAAGPGRR